MADDLHRLLDVQDLDVRADQLAHRRVASPVRTELAAADATLAGLRDRWAAAATRVDELDGRQAGLEAEVAGLAERAAGTDRRLSGGGITDPKALQALLDEVAGLRSRIGRLEDDVLEVMEAREPVSAELDALTATEGEAASAAADLRARVAADEASIDAELAEVTAARAALVASVPADLVARYEKIRARSGGVGIARLDGHRCTGCHLELPAREHDELRRAPADEIVVHEECGRILVRDP